MPRNFLQQQIEIALKELKYKVANYTVEYQIDRKGFGDVSTNVAFCIENLEDKNSNFAAEEIASFLRTKKEIEFVEVVNGFINIFFYIDYLKKYSIFDNKKFDCLKNKKIVFEYTDPNPFKEMHIGHLMTNTIGESLARLAESLGAQVKRVCYQGDVGLHVAKALWALNKNTKLKNPNILKPEDLSAAYVAGTNAYDDKAKEEIESINRYIYSVKIAGKNNKKILKNKENILTDAEKKRMSTLYNSGKKNSLLMFEDVYKRIGTKFDKHIFESEVSQKGFDEVEKGLENGVFVKDENAVVYKKSIHPRVFITRENIPTYEAKEIGLAINKEMIFKPDESYIITANEIQDYMKVVYSALNEIAPAIVKKTKHITHGILKLSSGKMSSREGSVIIANEFLDHLESLASGINKDKIAVAAFKYSILRQSVSKDIIFDEKKSFSMSGDSGPYLLYTYVRLKSILRKNKVLALISRFYEPYGNRSILRMLSAYDDVVKNSWDKKEIHHIVLHLTKLSSYTNNWYTQEKISGNIERIRLLIEIEKVLEHGLNIMGITPIEIM